MRRFEANINIILLSVFFVICVACSEQSNTATLSPNSRSVQTTPTQIAASTLFPTPTIVPTQAAKITAIPSQIQTGSTTIGAPISHFLAKYGKSTSDPGIYNFTLYSGSKDDLTVLAYPENHLLVTGILMGSPQKAGWPSLQDAIAACNQFLPSDAVYKRKIDLYNSGNLETTQRVYYSATLANLANSGMISASNFTDGNGNTTTSGIFGAIYNYDTVSSDTTGNVLECGLQIGLQQK